MLHLVAQLSSVLLQPLNWVALLLLVGAAMQLSRSPAVARRGRTTTFAAAVLLTALGWSAVPDALIRALEDQYAPPHDISGYSGVVVLGGVFSAPDGREHPIAELGSAAERVVAPVPLMANSASMRLLFTGGDASIMQRNAPESIVARQFLERMGIDLARVQFESRSRNTYENSLFSRDLPGVDIKQPWLLVTSAWHMPRAMAVFKRAGWNVTAYPVDYCSMSETQWLSYSLFHGVAAWRVALHEYFGLAVYRLTGRI